MVLLKKYNKEGIKQFKRFALPLSSYMKLKTGKRNPLLIIVDLGILVIPFSTIFVVFLVQFVLKDEKPIK